MPKARTFSFLVLLAAAAACGNDSTEPQVASVIVTPDASTIQFLGSTTQFTARAEDSGGNTVDGVTFTWESSNTTVATVDASGRATALAAGSAMITATAEGISGDADLTVDPADCTTDIELNPGEHEILPVTCDIFIPAGTGHRYRVAVLNENLSGGASAVTSVSFQVGAIPGVITVEGPATSPAQTASSTAEPIRLSARQEKHLRWAEMLQRRTRATHDGLRAAEAALMEAVGTGAVLPDRSREFEALAGPARQSTLPDKLQLRPNEGNSCTASEPLATALLLAQNDVMAIYQDSAQNANAAQTATPAQAQWMLDYYEAYGQTVIDDYFHGVPDVDGNGKIIVYISFFDDLSDGATAAYVWGGDLLDSSECADSNERELTYFNAALVRALDEDFEQALETVVHEVKHIASFWQGIARDRYVVGNPFQPSWIEEGTAEIAGNLSARRAWVDLGGPGPHERITEDELRNEAFDPVTDELYPELLGLLIRLNRAQGYLSSQPNGLVISPNGAGSGHSVYGSGWTFFRWLGDVYGDAGAAPWNDAAFFTLQNDSTTAPGIDGIEEITGKDFQVVLEEFAAGVMGHMGASEEMALAYTSYDFVSAIEMWCFAISDGENTSSGGSCSSTNGPDGTFPWPVTARPNGNNAAQFADGNYDGDIGPTGIRIHEFVSTGTGSGISLAISATQPAKLVVLRLN